MPYNFVADSFHTKKTLWQSFFKRFYTENGRFAFRVPLSGA